MPDELSRRRVILGAVGSGAAIVRPRLDDRAVPPPWSIELTSNTLPQPTGPRPHLFALTLERDQT